MESRGGRRSPLYSTARGGGLLAWGDRDEVKQILEEAGQVDMHCDYCGSHYVYASVEIAAIRNGSAGEAEQVH